MRVNLSLQRPNPVAEPLAESREAAEFLPLIRSASAERVRGKLAEPIDVAVKSCQGLIKF